MSLLREALSEGDEGTRVGALLALAALEQLEATYEPQLVELLEHQNRPVRQVAAEAVGRWERASDEVVAAVIETLEKERDPRLRLQLGLALMRWKPDDLAVRSTAEGMLVDAPFELQRHYGPGPLWGHLLRSWLETEEESEALGRILQQLMDSDSRYVRRMIVEMLASLEREGKIVSSVWTQALRDPDRLVREAALQRLFALEQVPEELAAGVTEIRQREEVPYLRQMMNGLALKLGQLVADEPELVEFLMSEQWQVRQAAAQALGRLEEVEAETVSTLVRNLTYWNSDVQQATREALVSLAKQDAEAVSLLREALSEGDEETRVGALLALAALEQPEATDEPQLVELLEHQNWRVRQAAAEALGRSERVGSETLVALVQALADSYSGVQQATREALVSLAKQDAEAVSLLREALSEGDEGTRVGALLALAALEQLEATYEPQLVELLEHQNWPVRQVAAEALGRSERVGSETLVALVQALADGNSNVQQAAQQTLIEFAERDELLTPALLVGLGSISTKVRIGVAELAGQLGDRCPEEIREVLRAMLGERRSDLRQAAANALLALDLVDDEVTNAFITDLYKDDAEVHEQAYESLLRIAGPECSLIVKKKGQKSLRA